MRICVIRGKKFLSDICRQKIIDFCGIRRGKLSKTPEFPDEMSQKALIDYVNATVRGFVWPKITGSSRNIVMKNDSQYVLLVGHLIQKTLNATFCLFSEHFPHQNQMKHHLPRVFNGIICEKTGKFPCKPRKWAFCKIMVVTKWTWYLKSERQSSLLIHLPIQTHTHTSTGEGKYDLLSKLVSINWRKVSNCCTKICSHVTCMLKLILWRLRIVTYSPIWR